eukprot:TRINITY_DN95248_c0_g1_i1.p1 TRINITY_DN95248_c0_g1~~TRINITY_DN95248_c0_g1_i1.p1  ORF type:complete len:155 (+),score=22.39 TRINITY_DN95248_c0_g1_i1:73-537(+)
MASLLAALCLVAAAFVLPCCSSDPGGLAASSCNSSEGAIMLQSSKRISTGTNSTKHQPPWGQRRRRVFVPIPVKPNQLVGYKGSFCQQPASTIQSILQPPPEVQELLSVTFGVSWTIGKKDAYDAIDQRQKPDAYEFPRYQHVAHRHGRSQEES